jgi:hypothetical protein
MSTPTYLVDVAVPARTVQKLERLATDLADEFPVEPGAEYHGTYSAPLFGPFETTNESGVVYRVESVCRNFSLVPYRTSRFGHFRDAVLFASIAPSGELDDLQSKIASGLRPITHRHRRLYRSGGYPFHVPIVHDVGPVFPVAWDRLNDYAPPNAEEYAYRVRILKDGAVLRVFDLPLHRSLDATEAREEAIQEETRSFVADHRVREHHSRLLAPRVGGYPQHLRRRWYAARERLRWLGTTLTWILEQVGYALWNRLDRWHARLSKHRRYRRLVNHADRTASRLQVLAETGLAFLSSNVRDPATRRWHELRLWLGRTLSPREYRLVSEDPPGNLPADRERPR